MGYKYLDKDGLVYLWSKIKTLLSKKTDDDTLATVAKTGSFNDLSNKPIIDSILDGKSTNAIQNASVHAGLAGKVDKINGKQLSTNDYSTAEKKKLESLHNYDDTGVKNLIANKVDKVSGKQLSTNDYTTTEKEKLAGLNNYDDTDVKNLIDGKVDKVDGKGLSSNDYTGAEKNKLTGIAAGAQVNVIETVKVNGTALSPVSKAVDVSVPTRVGQLSNDSKYQSLSEVQKLINDALSEITGIDFLIVSELPATGKKGVIYLLKHVSETNKNIYDEYIWLSSSKTYERIGSTDIDLSGYVLKSDMVSISNGEIDGIVAK